MKNIIQELLKKNHITQEEFAKEIGVTRQSVSNWIHKERMPKAKTIRKVAQYFRSDPDEIFFI